MEQTIVYSGRFLGFTTLDDYKLKYMRLQTNQGEYVIKIPKELRLDLYKSLQPGDTLTSTVVEKRDERKNTVKRKALTVEKLTEKTSASPIVSPLEENSSSPGKPTVQVLVCTKSDCARRGGQQIYQLLVSETKALGYTDRVAIRQTGCLKQCKEGPNVTILPKRKEFHNVRSSKQILQVVTDRMQASESTPV